jgi:8-oxo-dGTP pyrophosphatase MutT (NUDIX family)
MLPFQIVPRIEISFGIIPFQQIRGTWQVLLVLHRLGRHWSFPKGKGLPNEAPIDAAQRELKEETNLDTEQILAPFPLLERYRFERGRETVDKTILFFPALVRGEIQHQEEEIEEVQWVPLDQALEQLSFEEARVVLRAAMKYLPREP